MLLHENNFYQQIAYILSTFYPNEVYNYQNLAQASQNANKKSSHNTQDEDEEISICSPLLVSSICQLLYNLTVVLNKEAILMVNNHGIINLLVSYVKPVNLLTMNSDSNNQTLNENIIYMLTMICKYLNLCCQIDQNCVLMLLKFQNSQAKIHKITNNLVYDLIECLNLNDINRQKLKPFYCVLFELLSTFLNFYDDRIIVENCLIIISKCWLIISNYLIHDLLSGEIPDLSSCNSELDNEENSYSNLYESSFKFYSIYLAKLTQIMPSSNFNSASMNQNLKILCDNISYLFDSIEINDANQTILNESCYESDMPSQNSLGSVLTRKLIKLFDKYFLVDTNMNLKQIIANLIKGLLALSDTAKQVAVDAGLIETLVEHLKYTHSKLNLKSLSVSSNKIPSTNVSFIFQYLIVLVLSRGQTRGRFSYDQNTIILCKSFEMNQLRPGSV